MVVESLFVYFIFNKKEDGTWRHLVEVGTKHNRLSGINDFKRLSLLIQTVTFSTSFRFLIQVKMYVLKVNFSILTY